MHITSEPGVLLVIDVFNLKEAKGVTLLALDSLIIIIYTQCIKSIEL